MSGLPELTPVRSSSPPNHLTGVDLVPLNPPSRVETTDSSRLVFGDEIFHASIANGVCRQQHLFLRDGWRHSFAVLPDVGCLVRVNMMSQWEWPLNKQFKVEVDSRQRSVCIRA